MFWLGKIASKRASATNPNHLTKRIYWSQHKASPNSESLKRTQQHRQSLPAKRNLSATQTNSPQSCEH